MRLKGPFRLYLGRNNCRGAKPKLYAATPPSLKAVSCWLAARETRTSKQRQRIGVYGVLPSSAMQAPVGSSKLELV